MMIVSWLCFLKRNPTFHPVGSCMMCALYRFIIRLNWCLICIIGVSMGTLMSVPLLMMISGAAMFVFTIILTVSCWNIRRIQISHRRFLCRQKRVPKMLANFLTQKSFQIQFSRSNCLCQILGLLCDFWDFSIRDSALNALSNHSTVAWVTRPEHPKGVKDVVKQARRPAT